MARDIPPLAAPSLPSDTSWTLPANQPQRVVHRCLTSRDNFRTTWTISGIVCMMGDRVKEEEELIHPLYPTRSPRSGILSIIIIHINLIYKKDL